MFSSRRTYGCRRIAAQLARESIPASVGLVADLMREQGLVAGQPRAYKTTTVPGEQSVESPDLLDRDSTAHTPGTRLVGDITYMRTGEGWLYLATVIDLATRMVVGWAMAEHMRPSLVVGALARAHAHGHLADGAMFHSDRGAQYTSRDFSRYCKKIRVKTSLERTVVCWDNAAAESFFASLKNECYHREPFPTRARARFAFAFAEYIEIFYNRKRLHNSLGYRSPPQALRDHHTATTAASPAETKGTVQDR